MTPKHHDLLVWDDPQTPRVPFTQDHLDAFMPAFARIFEERPVEPPGKAEMLEFVGLPSEDEYLTDEAIEGMVVTERSHARWPWEREEHG